MSQTPKSPNDEHQHTPLIDHLIELRSRLIKAVIVVAVIFLAMYGFSDQIYRFVAEPLMALLPAGSTMIATEVTSPFLAPFKLTIVVAVFTAIPFILYQAWAFIAPGLYTHEKALAFPLLLSSIVLFYCGAAFAYFVVFPLLFNFFVHTGPEDVQVMTDINAYLNFVLKLFFAFGVAFEIPIATFLLIWTGICDAQNLAKKRPYIVLGCFVIGMLLTPPDIISQSLLAVPMWLLFEIGLFAGRFIRRKQKQLEAQQSDA